MFRAAVLSIVLTSLAAPNAQLLCRIWCDSHMPVRVEGAPSCHHAHQDTPALKAYSSCDEMLLTGTPFVREDVARTGVGADLPGDAAAPLHAADRAAARITPDAFGRASSSAQRLRMSVLRI